MADTLGAKAGVDGQALSAALHRLYLRRPVTDAHALQFIKEHGPGVLEDALGPDSRLPQGQRDALRDFVVYHLAEFRTSVPHFLVMVALVQKIIIWQAADLATASADIGDIVAAFLGTMERLKLFGQAQSAFALARTRVRGAVAWDALENALKALDQDQMMAALDVATSKIAGVPKRGDLAVFAHEVFELGAEVLGRALLARHRGIALVMLYGFDDQQREAVGAELMASACQLTGRQRA